MAQKTVKDSTHCPLPPLYIRGVYMCVHVHTLYTHMYILAYNLISNSAEVKESKHGRKVLFIVNSNHGAPYQHSL